MLDLKHLITKYQIDIESACSHRLISTLPP